MVVSVVGWGRLTARGRPFRATAATSINAVSRAQRIPSPARLLWLSPLLHAQLSHQLLRRESHPVFGWREVPRPNFAWLQVLHPLPFLRMPCWRAGCWRHVSPQRGGVPLMLCALLSPGVGVGVPDWLVAGGGCCTAISQPLALRQRPMRGSQGTGKCEDGRWGGGLALLVVPRTPGHYSQGSRTGKPRHPCTWWHCRRWPFASSFHGQE